MMTLVNRLTEMLVVTFDGVHYEFGPGDECTFPDDVALHLRKRSLIRDDPWTGEGVFALAIKGQETTEPVDKPMELLDRTNMPDEGNYRKNVEYKTVTNDLRNDGAPVRSALDNVFDVDQPGKGHAPRFRRVEQ